MSENLEQRTVRQSTRDQDIDQLGFEYQWMNSLVAIAKEAGAAIMQIYTKGDVDIEIKADASPVTAADLASHRVIVTALGRLTPHIPILSEEDCDSTWDERRHWQSYWLIDPLDGTKEFIQRNGEFTVNIAFIHQGRAVAGVVYVPAHDKCYFGALDMGAWRIDGDEKTSLPLPRSQDIDAKIIVGSRSHTTPGLQAYLNQCGRYELKAVGSSLKFCLLAEGEADIYPRLGLTSEWDTAAAQAVLESAGGQVVNDDTKQPLSYNQKESILNPYFIAYAPHYNNDEA